MRNGTNGVWTHGGRRARATAVVGGRPALVRSRVHGTSTSGRMSLMTMNGGKMAVCEAPSATSVE